MKQLIIPSAGHQPQLELTNTNVHFIMVCMEQLQFNNRHTIFSNSNFMKNLLFCNFNYLSYFFKLIQEYNSHAGFY